MHAFILALMLIGSDTAAADMMEVIGTAVRNHVAVVADVQPGDVEIRYLGLGASIHCKSEPEVLVDTRPGEDFRGRTEIRLTLVEDDTECGRFRLTSRIAVWKYVPVAARSTSSGEPVELNWAKLPMDEVKGESVDPENGPFLAVHPIKAGEAVTHRTVRKAPFVLAGARVLLQAVAGSLRVTAEGRILNDAELGERVGVASYATGMVVQGVLIDQDTVRVGGVR